MSIFIGGAWPYANGSLHLGHIAGLLPGDILARYFRLKGEDVLYVSGSDCHGTPIALRAREEGVNPEEITNKYHQEFVDSLQKLGFSFDNYSRTDKTYHHRVVQEIFKELHHRGYIYRKTTEHVYCESCQQFLPDRYVEGICPVCGEVARGDQCDYCSSLLDPAELQEKKCKICGGRPVVKETEHFYLALAKFNDELNQLLNTAEGWRDNAIKLTKRYLEEGLQDRAITRDLDWGVKVPLPESEDKRIYVWVDAVLGYLSATKEWAQEHRRSWLDFWQENTIAYYVHGKDNIPFHTLILPSLLKGSGIKQQPDHIISSEYLTIEGKKLSTSRNWAIWIPYILERYHPDSIRYFLIINGPEKRDSNFSWKEFIHSHNGELLGAYGNFVNRTLVFIEKYFSGKIPEGNISPKIKDKLLKLYCSVGEKIENGEFKSSLEDIFTFIREANKYFDTEEPWITVKGDREECENTIYNCVQIIANLANLLSPYLPFSSNKIKEFLKLEDITWEFKEVMSGRKLGEIDILFERIDKKRINEERKRLIKQSEHRES